MNFIQIKETCIYSSDLWVMKEFYYDLLGLEIIHHEPEKHIFFRAGNSVLLCFNPEDSKKKISPPGHYAAGIYHFAFEVDESEYTKHLNEIQQKGIKIIDQVKWGKGKESFYFHDPVGNVVEIVPTGLW